MQTSKLGSFTLVLTLIALTCGVLSSQSITATLTGTVRDASSSVVSQAHITLRNEASSDVRKTVTNSEGYYSIPAIPSGTYTLIVENAGFQTSEQRGLVFNSAERRNVDSTLQVGATNQSVVVQASAEAVIAVHSCPN